MQVLAVVNQKGGVGKTSVCLNVALTLSQKGFKVLIVDMDTQSSASAHLGYPVDDDEAPGLHSLINILLDEQRIVKSDIEKCLYTPVYETSFQARPGIKAVSKKVLFGFNLLPSTTMLSDAELQMIIQNQGTMGTYLKRILQTIEEFYDYDFVCIDCPPNNGVMTLNSLYVNNCSVIVPTDKSLASVRGIKRVLNLINIVSDLAHNGGSNHNGALGIVFNRYKAGGTVDTEIEKYIDAFYPIRVFFNKISETADNAKSEIEGILVSQKNKKAKAEFEGLVDEILAAIKGGDER